MIEEFQVRAERLAAGAARAHSAVLATYQSVSDETVGLGEGVVSGAAVGSGKGVGPGEGVVTSEGVGLAEESVSGQGVRLGEQFTTARQALRDARRRGAGRRSGAGADHPGGPR